MSQRHPDDDRPGGGQGKEFPGLPPEWADIVIPDDARELDAEAAEVRRQLEGKRRRNRVERVLKTRRWQRYGLSGPLTALVLLLVAFFGSLVLLLPSAPPQPQAVPLAHPAKPVGQIGALLPDVTLRQANHEAIALRDVRPALVALIPRGCRCRDALRRVISQTREADLEVLLVYGRDVPSVPSVAASQRVRAVTDPQWTLGRTYGASATGLTALFVRSDGVLQTTHKDVQASTFLGDDVLQVAGG